MPSRTEASRPESSFHMIFARDLQTGKQADVQFPPQCNGCQHGHDCPDLCTGRNRSLLSEPLGCGSARSVQSDRSKKTWAERAVSSSNRPSSTIPASKAHGSPSPVCWIACILNGSLVASNTMVREREFGTIEQLLMSPASTSRSIVAKIAPLFVLLCLMTLNAIGICRRVFHVPCHGSFLLVYFGPCCGVLCWHRRRHICCEFQQDVPTKPTRVFLCQPAAREPLGRRHPDGGHASVACGRLLRSNPIYHFGSHRESGHVERKRSRKQSGPTFWPWV